MAVLHIHQQSAVIFLPPLLARAIFMLLKPDVQEQNEKSLLFCTSRVAYANFALTTKLEVEDRIHPKKVFCIYYDSDCADASPAAES